MTNLAQPPSYIKLPVSIASAEVGDSLIVTMTRILGLCWAKAYRSSAAYAPDELAELLGRQRVTLYRHLKELEALQWLRVNHSQRRIVLQPLVRIPGPRPAETSAEDQPQAQPPRPEAQDEKALREALAEAGIVGQAARELVQKKVDPVQVHAWTLWTVAPEQEWMENAPGYVLTRLQQGDEAPAAYAELARLTPEETALIRTAWFFCEQYHGWPSLDDNKRVQDLAPFWAEVYEAKRRARTR